MSMPNQAQEPVQQELQPTVQEQPKADLQAGEKLFTIVLFLLGLFFFVQSLGLWGRMSEPRVASAAALPLFVSGVWTLFTLIIILENIRKSTPLTGVTGSKVLRGLRYAFPREVLVMLGAIVVYCLCLLWHVSFYIATPLFLWGSMCYLMKKDFVKNILWTALCIGFIVVVFRLLFGVILP